MKNELQRHKKSDGVKWFCTLLAVLMLAVAVTAAITQGFKNWNPYGWFDKQEDQPLPNDNGGAVITEGENNDMKLMSVKIAPEDYAANGISPLAETAFQLTATITPVNATNKAVDWTISFVNKSSEWANGKAVTDFVTVTPTSDGALTANVECVKDFGEQIKVTVTSRDNTAVTANCFVDYTQKLSAVKATFGITVMSDGMTKTFDLTKSGQAAEVWKFNYTVSAHTIEDSYTTTVKISFADGVSALESSVGADFTWMGETITSGMPSFDKSFFDKVFITERGEVSANPTLYNKLVSALSAGVTLFKVEVNTVGLYGSNADTYQIKVTSDGMNIQVEDIELGDTSIIF